MHFSASLAQFIKLSFRMNHLSSPHYFFPLLLALCLGLVSLVILYSQCLSLFWFGLLPLIFRLGAGV